jgi:signal transduction histidine kinase
MRSEDLPHLFNKFRQFKSDTLTGDRKGTGLGLVITKGIIEAHGGIVGAASEEGKGSSFYFTLPIK